jgi:hypothetical protein
MSVLRRRLADEGGFALVLVLSLIVLMTVLSVTLIGAASDESTRSRHAGVRGGALQAAEAGIDDYIAKLVSDHLYYSHYVHPGEATRRATDGTTKGPGAVWTSGLVWSYPSGKDAWRQLDGYEYDLQVTAPSVGSQAVGIVSTGRPIGSTDQSEWRVLQTLIRPSSVADFQMLAAADITYDAAATTYGKIYAGKDSNGVAHSVTHNGTAYGSLYAEGRIRGTPTLRNGARTYDSTTIRSVVKNPVNFNDFLTSLVDMQRASQAGGVFLSNASTDAWMLTFQANGTFLAQQCMRRSGQDVAAVAPTCGSATSYPVPSNGAIYVAQTAIVSGQVNGRVTVASNGNVVIGNTLAYVQTGDDVLGLVAANDMIVAEWAPTDLSWRAATIAQSGIWRSWSNAGSHGTMTFTGSTATNQGGYMSMFRTRVYQYDDSLLYLQPPWFPTVEDAYTIVLQRELSAR